MKLRHFIIFAVFFFNPLISNIDPLPDLVAYISIMVALNKPSYVHDDAYEVRKSARVMLIISICKLLSLALISGTDITMSLVMSFTFATVELLFGIPFILKLFDFLAQLSLENGNTKGAGGEQRCKTITVISFAVRLVCAFIPDLTALDINDGVSTTNRVNMLEFRPMLTVIFFVISLGIGIWWLVASARYFSLTVTREACTAIEQAYLEETKNRKTVFLAKDNVFALILLGIASLAIFDFSYNDVVLTPDSILGFVSVLSVLFLVIKKRLLVRKPLIYALLISVAGSICISIAEGITAKRYFSVYNYDSVNHISKAETMYSSLCAFSVISSIFAIITAGLIFIVIFEQARNSLTETKHLFGSSDTNYMINEFSKRAKRITVTSFVFVALSSIISALSAFLKPIVLDFILINSIFEVIAIAFFIRALLYFYDEAYKRIYEFS